MNLFSVERQLAGEAPPLKKKQYRELHDSRLRSAVLGYDNQLWDEYLRGCSHNIHLID